ncbi:hypothetical protein HAX54_034604 [Datura stramonium]|uniref:Uncharacterized protein n=1 Tax=Datura stramonium TaxID=4076 RepID=A0ABS8VF07_DATST|nr:hypothetical protein [Datura stramonium]
MVSFYSPWQGQSRRYTESLFLFLLIISDSLVSLFVAAALQPFSFSVRCICISMVPHMKDQIASWLSILSMHYLEVVVYGTKLYMVEDQR